MLGVRRRRLRPIERVEERQYICCGILLVAIMISDEGAARLQRAALSLPEAVRRSQSSSSID